MLTDDRTRTIVTEQVGTGVAPERSYDSAYMGRLALPATPLTVQQFPHILEAGIGTVSPTGADPYVYAYSFPTGTTPNTLKTYTIESFNAAVTADMQEMEYAFVESFTVAGNAGEAWTMASNWVGRQLTNSTATSLSTLVTVEELLVPRTKLYIDDTGGTVGTTQVTGTFMGATMTFNTGWAPVPVGDGQLYYADIKHTPPSITFSVTLELEDTSVVDEERAHYAANDIRLIQFDMEGASASALCQIDMAARWDTVQAYANSNGNTTVTFDGHVVYSSADSLFCDITVTNALASLP
jgi:hypothetical protein